jgi:hypothetical protein
LNASYKSESGKPLTSSDSSGLGSLTSLGKLKTSSAVVVPQRQLAPVLPVVVAEAADISQGLAFTDECKAAEWAAGNLPRVAPEEWPARLRRLQAGLRRR